AKSYRWYIDGQRISNKKNLRYKVPSSIPGTPTFVTVSLVAKNGGCIETFSKKMEVVYAPEIAIEDVSRCGEAAFVEVENTRGITDYRWKNSNGKVIGKESSISIRNSDTYTVEVRNSCNVRARDPFKIELKGSCVWPGDITADGTVNAQDFLAWGLASGRTGPKRPKVSTEYEAQYAPNDWSKSFPNKFDLAPGVNLKHADANGDGRINTQDLRPIANQLRQDCENGKVVQGSPVSLALSTNQQALTNGGELELDISLDGYNGADIEDAYGLIFSVAFNMPLSSTPVLDLQDSWMGTQNQNMRGWFVPSERDVDSGDPYCGYVAITRTNRQGIDGGGKVGALLGVIIIVDDLSPGGLSALSKIRTLGVSVRDAQLVTKSGKLIKVGTSSASSSLQIPIIQEEERSLFELSEPNISHISVFPNPFTHQLILEADVENDKETLLVIRDLQGKEVVRENMSLQAGFNEKVLDLNHLASGLYMAEIFAGDQIISVNKLIKQ
ncbi:MAG: T9SS type A sorting domain-containing protein, partial [Bacteroidota bacterium]